MKKIITWIVILSLLLLQSGIIAHGGGIHEHTTNTWSDESQSSKVIGTEKEEISPEKSSRILDILPVSNEKEDSGEEESDITFEDQEFWMIEETNSDIDYQSNIQEQESEELIHKDDTPLSDDNEVKNQGKVSKRVLTEQDDNRLMITEVFIDGTDEYIEIYNAWEQDFDGKFTLVIQEKEKVKNQTFSSFFVWKWEVVVLAKSNSVQNIDTIKLQNGLMDGVALNISIEYEGKVIDEFMVDEITAKSIDNQKTSLEKVWKDDEFIIQPANSSINLKPGLRGNPGKVFQKDEENIEEIGSWSIQTISPFSGTLVITEVFFSKENSWIEISNPSDVDYSGHISIQGMSKNKIFDYLVQIPAQSSIILSKNNKYLAFPSIVTSHVYTFDWKWSFRAQLKYWSGQIDELLVHEDWIKKIKGTEASFEKVWIDGNWITTRTTLDRKKNIRGMFVANPGLYFREWEHLKSIDIPMDKKDNETWDTHQNPLCQNFIDKYRIEVREIFPGNSSYPAFIEVEFTDNPNTYEQLRFSGSLLSESFEISNDDYDFWDKGKTFLISSGVVWENKGIDAISVADFNLQNSSWSLILEGLDRHWRQVLDIINVHEFQLGKSQYFSWKVINGCEKEFSQEDNFSPWFDKKFLDFFQIDTNPKIEYIYIGGGAWGGGSYSCPTKADLCPDTGKKYSWIKEENLEIPSQDSLFASWSVKLLWENAKHYAVKIEDIIYDPPWADKNQESITLLLTEGDVLDLTNLSLQINGKTKKKLTGILEYWISKVITGNFSFPNSSKDSSSIKVELVLGNQILDTYYYQLNPTLKEVKQPPKEWYKVYSVLDGDTFRYRDDEWKLQSVRLLGVDSPESNTARYKKVECYGKESKEYLTQLLKGKYVQLRFDEGVQRVDSYWRYLAYVELDGLNINHHLIQQGYAKEYTYKTVYTQQANFLQAQQEAQFHQRGMWSSQYCPDRLEQEKNHQSNMHNLILKIIDIDYNPDGKDQWHERIMLSVYDKSSAIKEIDFEQQWWIFVFEDQGSGSLISLENWEYWTGKFKDLAFLGKQALQKQIILQWDFGLPNTKSSCIALVQRDHLFDIACYEVQKSDKNPDLGSWNQFSSELNASIKILSILPNPKGKDAEQEFIELFMTGDLKEIDMESGFFLMINGKTKKKLTGMLKSESPQKFYAKFGFPNTHSCISLHRWNQLLDTFCYGQEKEGSIFTDTDKVLSELNTDELKILKKIQLKKIWNHHCIVYDGSQLACRLVPKTRIDPLLKNEAQMIKSALKTLENVLREKYGPLYYQTEIVDFFALLEEWKDALKSWNLLKKIGDKEFERKNFKSIYLAGQQQTLIDNGLNFLATLLPQSIHQFLLKKEQQWYTWLENKR